MKIEEIKVRLDNLSKRGFEGFEAKEHFHANAESDIDYLLSIIEQAEKALEKSIIQMRNDGEAIAEEMGYKFTDCDVIKEAIKALQVIRGK